VHHIEVDQDREGKSGTRTWKVCKTVSAASATEVDQESPADAKTDAEASLASASPDRLTLLTLADAKNPASVSQENAGQTLQNGVADAADATSYEENEAAPLSITESNATSGALRTITCPSCGETTPSVVEPGEPAWCKTCEAEYTAA
jgi:hypothetical protein